MGEGGSRRRKREPKCKGKKSGKKEIESEKRETVEKRRERR